MPTVQLRGDKLVHARLDEVAHPVNQSARLSKAARLLACPSPLRCN